MLKIRILSALLGIPLIMLVLYFGGLYLYIFAAAVSLIGLFEYYRAMSNINIHTNKVFGYISVALYYIMFLLPITFNRPGFLIALSVITLLTCEIIRQKDSIAEISVNILGITYIPFLFSHILFIEKLKYGNVLVWLPFLTAWFTDTSAYFIGIYMGKTKLCPGISPKKTVEGALGGIAGAVLFSLLTGTIINRLGTDIRLIHFLTTGFICGIASELGDLAASYIKRYAGIKDFGNIIPGHGGILDRFDSILFTAPVIYYYFVLIGDLI
ncbi:MAG: phosphatidate cytidylyltransferase [Gracilibacteraceae bacterium]|jgi:phosphatidate cytidylyltransferase|nr:phosphatidate cytidylyltransferase [Gracilibacteraceae bacterium]